MGPQALYPDVHRRRLLRAVGPMALAGLAGCVGGPPGGRSETPADSPGQPGSPDQPGTSTGPPDRPPHSFTVTSTRCGTQADRADVTFGDGTVAVEGTTWGNDACYTGRLESVALESGTLTLRVAAERRADAQGCAQCITEIAYRATVAVDRPPAEVVVVHRGERVTTARP